MASTGDTVRVWDPVVRIGHWLLVAAFFTAYLTEDDFMSVHVWAGYTVAAVVLFRLVWGFIGPEPARFTSFVRSPLATARYLVDVIRHRASRHRGHNPAGGAMVVALLASLAVTSWSGFKIYAIEENAGPLASFAEAEGPALDLIPAAYARGDDDEDHEDHDEDEAAEEFWEALHEASANFTLLLIVLHVAGVLHASLMHRENLVRSMLTGRKRP